MRRPSGSRAIAISRSPAFDIAVLNLTLEIVGPIFDRNEESVAGDWTYNARAGRAPSTDIRFALTVAREVHGAGWIVDGLLRPATSLPKFAVHQGQAPGVRGSAGGR